MNLMTWIVAWTVVTTVVIVVGYFRLTFGLHEVLGMRLGEPDEVKFYQEQTNVDRRFNRLDLIGMTLTVVSALMMLVIVILWAIESGGGA
jgi:hypothetical protein